MKTRISRSFTFESAHFLPFVPEGHKCKRLHGHSFKCTVEIEGEVNPQLGWVMDFGELKSFLLPLKKQLDHYLLNDIKGLENPTSENLVRWIWEKLSPQLPLLFSVSIEETCQTRCTYFGP